MTIAIVDYGMGNRRSVEKALEHVGARVRRTSDHDEIAAADGVLVPGVGAFPEAMRRLRAAGLDDDLPIQKPGPEGRKRGRVSHVESHRLQLQRHVCTLERPGCGVRPVSFVLPTCFGDDLQRSGGPVDVPQQEPLPVTDAQDGCDSEGVPHG